MVRKTKREKSSISIIISILLIATAVLIFKSFITPGYQRPLAEDFEEKTAPPKASVSIPFDRLHSPYAILIRLNDGLIMEKSSEEVVYPASLTKIMTAVVAIENLPDLEKEIILTNEMFEGLYNANASMAGFQPGEKVRAIDLLYGVLLPSGAEACRALANEVAGSEQDFVRIMNQKAVELGMSNTHFTNAIGLHHKNHYTAKR